MPYTATLTGVSPLDDALLFGVEFTNGANSVIPRNYSIAPGAAAVMKNALKARVQADLDKYNAKENVLEAIRLQIGTQIKDL